MMQLSNRFATAAVAASLLLQPLAASAASESQLTFSDPVTVTEDSTRADILRQSDNYKDGVLTIGANAYVFDDAGHLELKQPNQKWWCRWFGLFCPALSTPEMTVTLETARDIVRGRVIPAIQEEMTREAGRVLPLLAFARPEALPAGTVVRQFFPGEAPVNVTRDSWFLYLDLEPRAEFGHRVEYVLVDGQTGEVRRERAFSPPIFDGKPWLIEEADRFASPDRFYPADLADLPAPGSWPIPWASPALPVRPTPEQRDAAASPAPAQEVSVLEFADWKSLLLASAHAAGAGAPAAAAADPCAGQPRKKVAIVINGEPPERSPHFERSAAEAMAMFRRLGVGRGDLHHITPATFPTPADAIAEIERVGATLGPCDKLFFYITGHGTLVDENDDDVPDSPSTGIVYGDGTLEKARFGDSFLAALEKSPAGDVNIIVQSCFSGTMSHWIDANAFSPPAGSNWHVFVSAPPDEPSYGSGERGRASPFTEGLVYCMALKMHERGITDPTIEQIEEIMRECQKEMADAPEEFLKPGQPRDVGSTVVTVEPQFPSIIEEHDGRRTIPLTVRRSNTDRAFTFRYSTSDGGTATPGQDYERVRPATNLTVELSGTALSATVDVGVFGDTEIEPDETFYLWLPDLSVARLVTIVNDDFPGSSSSSRSSSGATTTGTTSVVRLEPITLTPGDAEEIDITVTFGDGLTVGAGDSVTVVIGDKNTTSYGYGDITITFCDPCEELQKAVDAKRAECLALQAALDAAAADLADLDRQRAALDQALKDAQAALDAFNNPKSSAESGGRRLDSSDLQIIREHNRALWGRYRSGELTAEQLEAEWSKGLSDEERARLKQEKRDELQGKADAAQQKLNDWQAKRDAAAAAAQAAQGAAEACRAELATLEAELEECLKKCVSSSSSSSSSSSITDGGSGAVVSSSSSSSSNRFSISSIGTTDDDGLRGSFTDPEGLESEVAPVDYRTGPEDRRISSSSRSSSRSAVAATSSSRSSSSSSSSSTAVSVPSTPQCAAGTTADQDECEDVCEEEGGSCVKNSSGCWSCAIAQCPNGTFANSCPSECTNGCDVVAQEGSLSCYQCKRSCAEVCESEGFAQVGTDWSSYVQGQVSGYTCVSGATVNTETATIGSCTCSNQPTVQIDATVPICRATVCGDVSCGQAAACAVGETEYTVSCTWGGWQKVGENQFKPVLGE